MSTEKLKEKLAEYELKKEELGNNDFTSATTAEESEKPFSAMKKAVAESKLKTYADLKGYSYDPDFWSEQIDGVIAVMNTQRDQAQSTK